MFDLRPLYPFDATEGQMPEGAVSPYGPANEKANCVPASFTAALLLAGFPDIDPEQVTVELYGIGYRGGFGGFGLMEQWIHDHVVGAPIFTDTGFDFAAAEAAGQAGQIIIVAGWIDALSVTFKAPPATFSHASLLVAHLAGEKFVIWNTWSGQFQTYDRAVIAASMYEMAIMAPTLHGGGGGTLGGPTPVSGQFQGATSIEHIAFVGQDGHLHHGYRDAAPPGSGWGWEDLGAPPPGASHNAEYLCNAAVTIQVVRVCDPAGAIWCRYAVAPGPWGDWVALGNMASEVDTDANPVPGPPGIAGPPGPMPTTGTIAGPIKVTLS